MSHNDRFHELMTKAMAGDDAGCQELFEDYELVLLQAIRRKLNKKVRFRNSIRQILRKTFGRRSLRHRPRSGSSPGRKICWLF